MKPHIFKKKSFIFSVSNGCDPMKNGPGPATSDDFLQDNDDTHNSGYQDDNLEYSRTVTHEELALILLSMFMTFFEVHVGVMDDKQSFHLFICIRLSRSNNFWSFIVDCFCAYHYSSQLC